MSESNGDWYLRHRDGVEHGPFELADLIAAARSGNIANDTALKHAVYSHDQWVFATRVQPVAEAMPQPTSRSQQRAASPAATGGQSPAKQTTTKNAESSTSVPAASSAKAPTVAPSPAASQTASGQRNDREATTVAAVPQLQPLRRSLLHNSGFPVPKTFPQAVLALFDFRFQRFVTPWIIQIGWALAVVVTLLLAAGLAYATMIGPSTPIPTETQTTDRGNWQFDPRAGQSLWESGFFRFGCGLLLLGIGLLSARVVCEGAIIFFRVAIDVRELKATLRDREQPGID